LSVWSNGLLLQNVGDNRKEVLSSIFSCCQFFQWPEGSFYVKQVFEPMGKIYA
jgi:hypothetical protein